MIKMVIISIGFLFWVLNSANASTPIIGEFETSNPETISGWACINGNSRRLHVHVWSDLNEFIGGTQTNMVRENPWPWFCGGNQFVQWQIQIPKNFWDGKTRKLHAYGFDADGSGEVSELSASPKIVAMPNNSSAFYKEILDQRRHLGVLANIDEKILTLDQTQNYDFFLTLNNINPWGTQLGDKKSIQGDKSALTSNMIHVNTASEYSWYQRGPVDQVGATFAQLQGVKVGMYIDTSKQPIYSHSTNIAAAGWFSQPYRLSLNGNKLHVTFELAIPTATSDLTSPNDVAVSIMGLVLNIADKNDSANKWFYYTAYLYDPRGSGDTYEIIDVTTGKHIIGHAIRSSVSKYGSIGPSSAEFSSMPYSDWRHFHWTLDRDQLQNVLNFIKKTIPANGYSDNPDDYVITGWNIGPESNNSTDGIRYSTIGVGLRNVQMYVAP